MSDELTPITRKETFLAKAGGQNVVTPTPITREETFLQAIIDNGGGGGGGTGGGVLVANFDLKTGALDKTWNEINNAPLAIIKSTDPITGVTPFYYIFTIGNYDGEYVVSTVEYDGEQFINHFYVTNSADGYPTHYSG